MHGHATQYPRNTDDDRLNKNTFRTIEMAQQVFADKPDDLGSGAQTHMVGGKNYPHKLSSVLHTYTTAQAYPCMLTHQHMCTPRHTHTPPPHKCRLASLFIFETGSQVAQTGVRLALLKNDL